MKSLQKNLWQTVAHKKWAEVVDIKTTAQLIDRDHLSNLIAKYSINLERDEKICKEKTRVDKLTASLTTIITENLWESTEKPRKYERSKKWWINALKNKIEKSRKTKE